MVNTSRAPSGKEPRWHVGPPPILRWKRWRPQLVLRQKYRRPITWTLRALALIGLGLSFAYMPSYVAFAVSLALAATEQLLERSVFLHARIHVQPMPSFEYDPAKWTSLAYVGLGKGEEILTHFLGLVFSDPGYARSFFALLRDWNLGADEDRTGNIHLSFVRDQDSYFLWLYPGHNREPVEASLRELERDAHHKRENAEPLLIALSPYFCKNFLIKGAMSQFLERVAPGSRFGLAAMSQTPEGGVEIDRSIPPLWLHTYKIRDKSELSDADYEYAIWKMKGKL
jgi:hypothetical protein